MDSQSVALCRNAGDGPLRAVTCSGRGTVASPISNGLLLLVIDCRMGIYQVHMAGGVPRRVIPYDPYGYRRRPNHVWDNASVAMTLGGTTPVLVFANGTRGEWAMQAFLEYLAGRHPDVHRRVIGSMTLNDPELTEEKLLASVRTFCELITPCGTN